MPADPDWYQDALKRKGAIRPCQACGKTDWAIEHTRGVVPSVSDHDDLDLELGVIAVRLSCTNCGLVRLHNTHFLLDEDN